MIENNYEVTIVIPPETPVYIRNRIYAEAEFLASKEETIYDDWEDDRDWDLGVCGGPANHTIAGALERAEDAILVHKEQIRQQEIRLETQRNSIRQLQFELTQAKVGLQKEQEYRRAKEGPVPPIFPPGDGGSITYVPAPGEYTTSVQQCGGSEKYNPSGGSSSQGGTW